MAKVANPRKVFNFVIEIDGIDQFEVQKVTLPEVEIEQVEHGDVNHVIKTGGMIKVGNMTFEKLKPLSTTSPSIWNWMRTVQSQILGGGVLSEAYKKIIIVKEKDSTGIATLNSHICTGCWPTKLSQTDFERISSDNVLETAEFSVDIYEQI